MLGGMDDRRVRAPDCLLLSAAVHGQVLHKVTPLHRAVDTPLPDVAQQTLGKNSIAKDLPQRPNEPSMVSLGQLTHGGEAARKTQLEQKSVSKILLSKWEKRKKKRGYVHASL